MKTTLLIILAAICYLLPIVAVGQTKDTMLIISNKKYVIYKPKVAKYAICGFVNSDGNGGYKLDVRKVELPFIDTSNNIVFTKIIYE